MAKLITILTATVFVAMTMSPIAYSQDQKKEQIHKGTPEAGTVQKKDQKKAKKKDQKKTQKKDGSGAAKKDDEATK